MPKGQRLSAPSLVISTLIFYSSLMLESTYTSIPDTADLSYWEAKLVPNSLRSITFVPRDKVLHQQLKVAAWAITQACLPKKRRKGHY